jgi:hypothetical protein
MALLSSFFGFDPPSHASALAPTVLPPLRPAGFLRTREQGAGSLAAGEASDGRSGAGLIALGWFVVAAAIFIIAAVLTS